MNLRVLLLPILLVAASISGFSRFSSQTQDDKKLEAILQSISNVSQEGQKIIQRVMRLKPELNGMKSTKSLGWIVDDYSLRKGAYSLTPIGWEASQKKNGRWKIIFHYQVFTKEYHAAEWEYNEETNKIYAFESKNAPTFWTGAK